MASISGTNGTNLKLFFKKSVIHKKERVI